MPISDQYWHAVIGPILACRFGPILAADIGPILACQYWLQILGQYWHADIKPILAADIRPILHADIGQYWHTAIGPILACQCLQVNVGQTLAKNVGTALANQWWYWQAILGPILACPNRTDTGMPESDRCWHAGIGPMLACRNRTDTGMPESDRYWHFNRASKGPMCRQISGRYFKSGLPILDRHSTDKFCYLGLFLYLHNGDNNVSFGTSKDQNFILYLDIRTKHRLLQALVVFISTNC